MKINIKALLTVYISFFICINLVQCGSLTKIAPEYAGVDPKAEHFVKEFKELAAMQGIVFKHNVTVGFKKIDEGSIIGLTTYGSYFREIDLDQSFWNRSTEMTRFALVAHEGVHAYCDRLHDWGIDGTPYPEYEDWNEGKEPKEGHYRDGTNCPLSIMYPAILSDFCMLTHYTDYVIEMFNRCKPY